MTLALPRITKLPPLLSKFHRDCPWPHQLIHFLRLLITNLIISHTNIAKTLLDSAYSSLNTVLSLHSFCLLNFAFFITVIMQSLTLKPFYLQPIILTSNLTFPKGCGATPILRTHHRWRVLALEDIFTSQHSAANVVINTESFIQYLNSTCI